MSAASALIYEVVATNILFFYFIESSYSIATVLSVFLFGLAIGSISIHYISTKIKNKKLFFVIFQVLISIYAFVILSNLLNILPTLSTLGTFIVSFIILLVPTFFLGAVFPLAGMLYKKGKREIIGLLYSSDLFGAIIGSLIAGFFLIPVLGAKIAVIFGAFLNIFSAVAISTKKQSILPIFVLFIFLVSSFGIYGIVGDETSINYSGDINNINHYDYYANSAYGIVKIENGTLYIDERVQCCPCWSDDTSERKMAEYALDPLKEKNNIQVLNIGLGCGLTASKCLEYNTTVDIVEINEKVIEANRLISDVQKNPNVNVILNDGLSYLRSNNKKYDSILIDIENPSVAHSSNLYTTDAFEIINESLKNDGTFTLWTYSGPDRYFDILYYSLKECFLHVYSYDGVFLATNDNLNQLEYVPTTSYAINTINKNTLTDAYLG